MARTNAEPAKAQDDTGKHQRAAMSPTPADHFVRRVMAPAYRDRELDILDQRWLGHISNEQALKLLTELYEDWHAARTTLREIEKVS